MPSAAEYLAAMPDVWGEAQKGANYANSIYAQAQKVSADQANTAAGGQYASGDYAGAAGTLARSGDIENAQKVQATGQQQNMAALQYLGKALPVLKSVYTAHAAEGPDAQKAAVVAAFRQIAPEAKMMAGVSDQALSTVGASLAADPLGTFQRLEALIPVEWKTAGDSIFATQGSNIVNQATGTKFMSVPPGGSLYSVGGDAGGTSAAVPPGAATPAQAPAQSGTIPSEADAQAFIRSTFPGSTVTSGQRTPEHNAAVGGVPDSMHLSGQAVDFVPPKGVSFDTIKNDLAQAGYPATELLNEGDHIHWGWGQKGGTPPPSYGAGSTSVDQVIQQTWGDTNYNRWVQAGRHWAQLPGGIRDSIGRIAFSGGKHPTASQAPSQPPPQQQMAGNAAPGGARLIAGGQPAFRPPSPDEAKTYPGASYMTPQGPKYPPSVTLAANVPDSAIDFAAQTYLRTGKMPTGTRNPTLAMRIVQRASEMAKQQGMSVSDVIGAQQYRQSLSGALTQSVKIKSALNSYLGTFDKNLASLRSVIPQGTAKSVPIINRWIQAGRQSLQGDPDVTRLNVWIAAVRDEYAKILSGSTGSVTAITDAARSEADGLISNIQTPDQLYSAINAMEAESRNRLSATNATIGGLNNELRSVKPNTGQQTPSGAPQPARPSQTQYTPAQRAAMKKYGLQ